MRYTQVKKGQAQSCLYQIGCHTHLFFFCFAICFSSSCCQLLELNQDQLSSVNVGANWEYAMIKEIIDDPFHLSGKISVT